ncbi:ubiquitin carboxyl-terminal hydrolase 38 [Culex quinquefasciatus]|uniref:Ubiquitin carboxyl-terminal hydrolase 38 n=1 Tax=Culex quinquefasciatus TaxID=7176 RepID=B0WPM6_CULQU|nr:ubiquitin carboxyl-terminal hydrolase 38 [Culex quinquefasciatus]|eukprot:XP_001850660.1 ubiquitin carboxyl-terminal hydrolase 38 [Culex quinquefasciatus]
MAVKQHVTELGHSQPKYDIESMSKMIELIAMLQANPDSIPSNATSLKAICEEIVLHLTHTPASREVQEIKLMKSEIGKICQFFRDLEHRTPEHYGDIVSTCLKKLYKHIITEDEVSNYGSAILVLIDKARIKPGVQWILQEAENSNAIKKIFKTLAGWLETIDYAPDLTTWVVEILNGLREECLQQYPRSDNFRQALDVPQYKQYSFQNIAVVPTNAKVGLVNLGNTCYMNSVLQALVMTKQFSREILLSRIDEPLFYQIQKLLALLLHSDRPELTPRALLVAARPPDFVPGYQQDSSEFLGYLLEKLHEQERKMYIDKKPWNTHEGAQKLMVGKASGTTNSSSGEESNCYPPSPPPTAIPQASETTFPPTLIQKTFDGKLFVTYQCGVCGSKSTNLDAFRSFELSFPEPTNMSNYTVQKLLDFYCSSEKLIGDNQYYCDNCKQLCDGERSIRIIKSPKNLILTLKHFQYDQQRHTRAKLMNKVLHDEIISLRVVPELEPASIVRYSLYAAVVHAGTSMDSGHYYTYAQDKPDCWYKFNDNFVTKVSVDELHTLASPNTPYILFYQLIPTAGGGINSNSLDLDDDMEPSVSLGTAGTDCQLPELEDLPLHLREIVHGDNQSYNEEIRSESRKKIQQRALGINKFVLPRNHDSDKDDPPPSSCGGSSVDYSNRFIY